jgi:hypothetical protein
MTARRNGGVRRAIRLAISYAFATVRLATVRLLSSGLASMGSP